MKEWILREAPSQEVSDNLSNYSPFIRDLLFYRGILEDDEARTFLNPDYETDFHDPFLILNMDKAVSRIMKAMEKDEKIVIFGDYDADGLPASVLLADLFSEMGHSNFEVYIPHRYKEGYGLNKGAVKKFIQKKASILITIDCGITNHKEIASAEKVGIDVIVLDHHIPHEKLPNAYAILNTHQKDDKYPFKHLCGGGLSFKLAQAIAQKTKKNGLVNGWEKWLLDVAGISTISDMVPLVGENRAIAHFGLRVLQKTRRPGLLELMRVKHLSQKDITEEDISFTITPHINAASRMDTPAHAYKLLSTDDDAHAEEIVALLTEMNNDRKRRVEEIINRIEEILHEHIPSGIISIGDSSWEPGVLGLAAQKIMERYKMPVCLWGKEGSDVMRGSCRANGTVNIVELMGKMPKKHFIDYGGHASSGGFSLTDNALDGIQEAFRTAYGKVKNGHIPKEELFIEKKLSLDDVTWANFKELIKLAPFGIGNPKPVFLFENILIDAISFFGKTKDHLKLEFKKENGEKISAVKFFTTPESFKSVSLANGSPLDVAATIEKNSYFRSPELRLRIIDIKQSTL